MKSVILRCSRDGAESKFGLGLAIVPARDPNIGDPIWYCEGQTSLKMGISLWKTLILLPTKEIRVYGGG
jgi:hypothetical protein